MSARMLCTDAVAGLKGLAPASVDLVVTDPAYESLEKWRAQGTTTRLKKSKSSSNEWFPVVPNSYFPEFFAECFRVLKKDTHIYVFCDPDTMFEIRPMMVAAGFEMRKPLIWRKVNQNQQPTTCPKCGKKATCGACGHPYLVTTPAMGMGYPFRSNYEVILLGLKGKRKPPENRSVLDVLDAPRVKEGQGWTGKGIYPTEKPVALAEVFIQQSSEPGELVVDPFAGSGALLEAARRQGREALGFDIQQATVDRFNGVVPTDAPTPSQAAPQSILDLFAMLAGDDDPPIR